MTESQSMRPTTDVAELLANAAKMLSDVEESDIMKSSNRRKYPAFESPEVVMGEVLGVGGFGIVSEVAAIRIKEVATAARKNNDYPESEKDGNDTKDSKPNNGAAPLSEQAVEEQDHENDEHHFDVETAKQKLAKRCRRFNKARYAIKRLDPSLSEKDRTRGMVDMALEVKYLTVLWHPNIVKMRGISLGNDLTPEIFFVMDRLFETLDKRMDSWKRTKKTASGIFGFGGDKSARRHLLVERLVVAYDLAAAFSYIHENNFVYRDIKMENCGFDIRGDVKVFDFGLMKALLPSLKVKRSKMYRLTPITGSLPYMAPEVALKQPYNCSCDCFSFGLLFYELLALKETPYHGYAPCEYFKRVVKGSERPAINRKWPMLSKGILKDSWDRDPARRPSMKNVASAIREDLSQLSEEEDVLNRTRHMLNRSNRSMTYSDTAPSM